MRLKSPIYVAESVLENASVTLQNGDDHDETIVREKQTAARDYNLEVYRDFINGLEALDEFGKQD